jgi:hypothetical protein
MFLKSATELGLLGKIPTGLLGYVSFILRIYAESQDCETSGRSRSLRTALQTRQLVGNGTVKTDARMERSMSRHIINANT